MTKKIVEYKLCPRCAIEMIKLKASLCKNCKPRRNHDNYDGGCKFYSYKFSNMNEKINLKRILVKPYDFILGKYKLLYSLVLF